MLKICNSCGKPFNAEALADGTFWPLCTECNWKKYYRGNIKESDDNQEHPKSDENNSHPFTVFPCKKCEVKIRIKLKEGNFKCPNCKTSYQVTIASSDPLAYILLPDFSQNSPKPQKDIPAKIKSAFAFFGIDEDSTFEQVRTVYRESVRSYHPDKVAHLGAELRRVAEVKTKEINSTYAILEGYFSNQA